MASPLLFLAFLLATVISAPSVAAQTFDPFPGLTCDDPRYIVEAFGAGLFSGYSCVENPCNPNPCGAGNTCTVREANQGGRNFFYVPECVCNAPYVAGLRTFGSNVRATTCYIPGQNPCTPTPCQSRIVNPLITCSPQIDPTGTPIPSCACPMGLARGRYCQLGTGGSDPAVQTTVNGITGAIAMAVPAAFVDQLCPPSNPIGCLSSPQTSYICCTVGCGPLGPDRTPLCRGDTFVPTPNAYTLSSTPLPPGPLDQGDCGYGFATSFPTRCLFNDDPQGRYICCDAAGCGGFAADNTTPVCTNGTGYVTPGFGVIGLLPLNSASPPTTSPTTPPATTSAPTSAPTTSAPTSAPTTSAPTSAPSTSAPDTSAPTTSVPTSVPTTSEPTEAPTSTPTPVPNPAPTPLTLVPGSTQCPSVNGVYTNSCFDTRGTMHVCCIDPGTCGPYTADGNPTCTNNQYYNFN